MSDFTVIAGPGPANTFVGAHRVVRGESPAEAGAAFDEAEAALDAGYWIAGYITYEGGVRLGIFDPPREHEISGERGDFREAGDFQMSALQASVTRGAYDMAIARIRDAIYEGDVYQVNYTVPFAFTFEGDPLAAYSRLARASGARYCAYVRDGDQAVLSFSPELFLRFDGNRLTAQPMKGTAQLDRVEELDSVKNRAEHVMIVDLLRNDLHRIGCAVEVERLFEIERYPTFATMISTVRGVCDPLPPLQAIFDAVFPCGSVTGAPKVAAMRQIAALESQARGAYCGSVGFLSPARKGWWNVAIRTAQLDCSRGIGRYDAGGGIVSDSDAESEWQEAMLKTQFFSEFSEPLEILETLSVNSLIHLHMHRLRKTAEAFDFPYNEKTILSAINQYFNEKCIIRLRLRSDGSIVCKIEELEEQSTAVRVCISDVIVQSVDPMLRWKTSWRAAYDRAMMQARETGCFEGLLCNERGEITEGSRTNVFARVGGILYTPPLRCGLLPGVLRERLLANEEAIERVLLPADLRNAEELYVGNSARGLLQATLVETLTSAG